MLFCCWLPCGGLVMVLAFLFVFRTLFFLFFLSSWSLLACFFKFSLCWSSAKMPRPLFVPCHALLMLLRPRNLNAETVAELALQFWASDNNRGALHIAICHSFELNNRAIPRGPRHILKEVQQIQQPYVDVVGKWLTENCMLFAFWGRCALMPGRCSTASTGTWQSGGSANRQKRSKQRRRRQQKKCVLSYSRRRDKAAGRERGSRRCSRRRNKGKQGSEKKADKRAAHTKKRCERSVERFSSCWMTN